MTNGIHEMSFINNPSINAETDDSRFFLLGDLLDDFDTFLTGYRNENSRFRKLLEKIS